MPSRATAASPSLPAPNAPDARSPVEHGPDGTLPCAGAAAAPAVRRLASDAVFAGAAEVLICHRGVDYRLRQTTLGKLILTK